MGKIKSALEIALEKTASIAGDKDALDRKEMTERGQKAAAAFLSGTKDETAFRTDLKSHEDSPRFADGVVKGLLANLVLPLTEEYRDGLDRLKEGFSAVLPRGAETEYLFQELGQFFGQYLANRKSLEARLEEQFAPRLRQKEQEMAQQLGSAVQLQARQDPEFLDALAQNLSQLEAQYSQALQGIKDEIRAMRG